MKSNHSSLSILYAWQSQVHEHPRHLMICDGTDIIPYHYRINLFSFLILTFAIFSLTILKCQTQHRKLYKCFFLHKIKLSSCMICEPNHICTEPIDKYIWISLSV